MIKLRLSALFCLTILFGCSSTKQLDASSHVINARALAGEGKLFEASVQLKLATSIEPNNSEYIKFQNDVQSEISAQIVAINKKLEGNRLSNKSRKKVLLKLLALKPDDKAALNALRKLTEKRPPSIKTKLAVMSRKAAPPKKAVVVDRTLSNVERAYNKQEYASVVTIIKASNKSYVHNTKVSTLLLKSCKAIKAQALSSGSPEYALSLMRIASTLDTKFKKDIANLYYSTSYQLSKSQYEQGMRLLVADLPKAITHFEKSVVLDPSNNESKQQLEKAKTMYENLKKIRGFE